MEFETSQLKKKLELEVDQLKKKNVELEQKLESVLLTSTAHVSNHLTKKNAIETGNSREFLPRSCYELKATKPTAQSGFHFIDPDGQINGDDPVLAYCDMDTSILIYNIL